MLRALALALVLALLAPPVAARARADCPKGQSMSPRGECKPERKVKKQPVKKDPAEQERLRREQEESERNRRSRQER